jgi:hypothetical protein
LIVCLRRKTHTRLAQQQTRLSSTTPAAIDEIKPSFSLLSNLIIIIIIILKSSAQRELQVTGVGEKYNTGKCRFARCCSHHGKNA